MKVNSLTKKYRRKLALAEVSFELSAGCVALLGPNGAGKTTLISCIAGLEKPSSGSVELGPGDAKTGVIGYLPQQFNFMSHLTTAEALSYLAALGKIKSMDLKTEVARVIELANLSEYAETRVGELSGGTLRRLGIAQALLGSPELLLLDEPTVGIDIEERANLKSVLARIASLSAMIISTHVVDDIKGLCDRILVLNKGRLCFDGTPAALTAFAEGRVYISKDEEPALRGGVASSSLFTSQSDDATYRYIMPVRSLEYCGAPTLEEGYLALLHGYIDRD